MADFGSIIPDFVPPSALIITTPVITASTNMHTVGSGGPRKFALLVSAMFFASGAFATKVACNWGAQAMILFNSFVDDTNFANQITMDQFGLIGPLSGNHPISLSWTNPASVVVSSISFYGAGKFNQTLDLSYVEFPDQS